jgi:hypothetical protein
MRHIPAGQRNDTPPSQQRTAKMNRADAVELAMGRPWCDGSRQRAGTSAQCRAKTLAKHMQHSASPHLLGLLKHHVEHAHCCFGQHGHKRDTGAAAA